MQNNNDNQSAGPKPNTLGNDEILEFAEEVLGSEDTDDIINLEDTQTLGGDNNDDIIDLTDVADEPEKEETDEVLDLTDIADGTDADDDIIDLDEIAVADDTDTEEVIMELEDVIDAADEPEDDIVDLEDIADEPVDDDNDILDIEEIDSADLAEIEDETDEGQSFIDEEEIGMEDLDDIDELSPEDADIPEIETDQLLVDMDDTIDLDMPDSAIKADAPAAGPIGGLETDEPEPAPDVNFEQQAQSDGILDMQDIQSDDDQGDLALQDIDLDDIADQFEAAGNDAETDFESAADIDSGDLSGDIETEDDLLSPADLPEAPDTEPVIDMLDTDEEAVNLDGFEAESLASQMTAEATDQHTDMTIPAMEPDADQEFEPEAPAEIDEPDMITTEDLANIVPAADDDEVDGLDISESADKALERLALLDDEPGMPSEDTIDELFPQQEDEPEEDESASALEQELTPEFEEPILSAEPPAPEPIAETEPSMTDAATKPAPDTGLELDLESDADSGKSIKVIHKSTVEKEYPPVEEPEDLSIEGINAAEDITPLEQVGGAITVELSGTEQLEEGQAIDETGFEFGKVGDADDTDIHRTADPISIKVKEHGVEDHANADDLLKVFDNQAGSASLEGLEPAIEQAVQKVLADKIEVLLTSAIEKAVSREIERLKGILLSDLRSDHDA